MASFVQGPAGVSGASVSSLAATFASNVTAGNTIVAAFKSPDRTSYLTTTDSLGNAYVTARTKDGSSSFVGWIFASMNILGGACTVTVATTVSTNLLLGINEYNITGIPDRNAAATATSTAASSGALTATGSSSSLYFGMSTCVTGGNSLSLTWTGATERQNVFANNHGLATADFDSTSVQTATWTVGGSALWVACIFCLSKYTVGAAGRLPIRVGRRGF